MQRAEPSAWQQRQGANLTLTGHDCVQSLLRGLITLWSCNGQDADQHSLLLC